MTRVKNLLKETPLILLLVLLSLPLIFPLMHEGFFVTDDGDLMIIRLTAFHEAIMQGQFPARFLPRLYFQYGYPVSNFLYPGYLYIGEILHLIRFGFINSIKIILGLSFIFSGVFSFLWLRQFLRPFSSVIGSLVYLYSPYHYYDVYKRGSVGEVLALTVMPFVLWAIETRYISLCVAGITLLILSHNTLAILFIPLLLIYYGFRYEPWKSRTEMMKLCLLFGVSLLISAFFWIPALYDLQYTIFSQTTVSDLGNYFTQIDPTLFTNLSLFYLLVIAVCSLVLYKVKDRISISTRFILLFFGIISIICLFLNTPYSLIIWKNLPIMFIQFPFRLFSLVMVFLALFTGVVTDITKGKSHYMSGILLCILFSFPLFFFIRPLEYSGRDDMYYSTNEDSTTVKNEYLPKWVNERSFTKPKVFVEGKGVEYLSTKKGVYMFNITGTEARRIRVNMLYYPGWVAHADNKPLSISYANNKGVMDISLPKNTRQVTLKFTETPVRAFSNFLSLVGLSMFGFFFIKDTKAVYERFKK